MILRFTQPTERGKRRQNIKEEEKGISVDLISGGIEVEKQNIVSFESGIWSSIKYTELNKITF